MTSEERQKRNEAVYRWRKRHPEASKALNRRSDQKNREEKKMLLAKIKDVPCMDCKQHFPTPVMEFDHRDPATKRGNIGNIAASGSWGTKRLLEEIEKCDIVCANCHRMRHFRTES